MIKLKDILSESKFGHLVEKDKGKPLSDKDKQKIKDLGLVWKGKGYGKEKEDKVKYGTTDFSRSDTESYAKDVQQYYNYIIKGDFR